MLLVKVPYERVNVNIVNTALILLHGRKKYTSIVVSYSIFAHYRITYYIHPTLAVMILHNSIEHALIVKVICIPFTTLCIRTLMKTKNSRMPLLMLIVLYLACRKQTKNSDQFVI